MFKVRIDPRLAGKETDEIEYDVSEIPARGGWTDDPGDGRAVLLPDGREVLNPLPMAPPVGYRPEPTIQELVHQMILRHHAGLAEDEEVDTIEDAEDFDIPDELEPMSMYEVEMVEEFPEVPPEKPEAAPPAPPLETPPVSTDA